ADCTRGSCVRPALTSTKNAVPGRTRRTRTVNTPSRQERWPSMIDETLPPPPVQTRHAHGGRRSVRPLPILTAEVPGGTPAAIAPTAEHELERALAVARTADAAPLQPLRSTKKRTLSRRGILWLGQTCNLHCAFCYFIDRVHDRSHAQHGFM